MFELNWARLLRRKKEDKASRTVSVDVRTVRGQDAVWTPRDYTELAREGYQNATWVYVCIREIVNAIKSVPLIEYRDTGNTRAKVMNTSPALKQQALKRSLERKELEEIEGSELLELLNSPNEFTTGGLFKEQAFGFLMLSGNAYVELVGPRNRPPMELFVKRPDRMKVKPDSKSYVGGYEYRVNDSVITFRPEEIIHTKTFHPLNDWYGMGVVEAAARGIDMFNTGTAHNVALLQNGARPSGAWVTEGSLDDNQFARLQHQSREWEEMSNKGRSLLLENGMDWKEMGISPKDLDWLEGLRDAARQIHAAFGVHPVLTGLQTGTFENQEQAIRQLYMRVALPLLEHWLGDLNRDLVPLYGENRFLWYDRDAIPALSEDQDSLWSRATSGWEKGWLTRNEAREMAGFEAVDGGDVFLTEVHRLGTPSALDNQPEDPEDSGKSVKAFNLTTEEQKTALWKAKVARQERWEGIVKNRVSELFQRERREIISRLRQANDTSNVSLLAQVIQADSWKEELQAVNLAVAEDFGRETLEGMPKGFVPPERKVADLFDLTQDEVLAFILTQAGESSAHITATSRALLKATLAEGVAEGEGIPDLAKRVDALYLEQIIPNRSETIARTEVIRASNFGSQAAAKSTGLVLDKVWLSTRDTRTRDSHRAADGQRRPLDARFDVAGELLMFPGDPSGSASNTVQCRCSEFYETRE